MTTKPTTTLTSLAIRITRSVGSTTSIVIHTIGFVIIFGLAFVGFTIEQVLLVLTTIVSLEAIYLSLLIQMTVNRNTESLEAVEEDIEAIERDVDEIEKDVDEISQDIDEIEKDVDEISHDIDEIQKDEAEAEARDTRDAAMMASIEQRLAAIVTDLDRVKRG